MLLYKSIVEPGSVYSAFIIFLQKGQSKKRKGINPSFFMRALIEQGFFGDNQCLKQYSG